MGFYLKLLPLYIWSTGDYAVAILDNNELEVETPFIEGTQPGQYSQHCVTFYYNLGEHANLEVGKIDDYNMYRAIYVWLGQSSDPRNTWLRGEATMSTSDDKTRVCRK